MSSQIIPSPVPPINTSRLFIRPIQESDAPDIYAIRGRYDVMKWSKSKKPDANIDATEKWIRDNFTGPSVKRHYNFSIRKKDASSNVIPRVIGVIGVLFQSDGNPAVGYIFHPDFWGKGYATESLRGLLDAWWALPLEETDAGDAGGPKADGDVLFAETEKENSGSLRVLDKCGFRAVDEFDDEGVQVVVLKLTRPS